MHENDYKGPSKSKLKQILKSVDLWEIRNKVFDLYNLGEINEPSYKTLMKCHMKFIQQCSHESL